MQNSGQSVWHDYDESSQRDMPDQSLHKFIHQITLNPYSTCRPCTLQCSLTGFRIWVTMMNDNVHSFDFYLKNIKSLLLATKEDRRNSPKPCDSGRVGPGPPGLNWVKFCTICAWQNFNFPFLCNHENCYFSCIFSTHNLWSACVGCVSFRCLWSLTAYVFFCRQF